LVRRCLKALHEEAFRHWNGSYAWLMEDWNRRLEDARTRLTPDAVDRIAPVVIALCCMPLFQYSPHAAPTRSPNLVLLGDYDAGLFGLLADADPWFDALFAEQLPNRHESMRVRLAAATRLM
jgi:hypothetical protein